MAAYYLDTSTIAKEEAFDLSTFYGIVHGNIITLLHQAQLPEGQIVEVHVAERLAAEMSEEQREQLFRDMLIQEGLVLEFKDPRNVPPGGDRTPVHIPGKPLSEQIIEDRR